MTCAKAVHGYYKGFSTGFGSNQAKWCGEQRKVRYPRLHRAPFQASERITDSPYTPLLKCLLSTLFQQIQNPAGGISRRQQVHWLFGSFGPKP